MLMAANFRRLEICNEELVLFHKVTRSFDHYRSTYGNQTCQGGYIQWRVHDPLIMWSSNFDFYNTSCRFKTQVSKLSPTSCFHASSPQLFRNITEFETEKYFTDHGTANIIQLFVGRKRHFSGLLFLWTYYSKGEFPRDYLINVTSIKQTLTSGQKFV